MNYVVPVKLRVDSAQDDSEFTTVVWSSAQRDVYFFKELGHLSLGEREGEAVMREPFPPRAILFKKKKKISFIVVSLSPATPPRYKVIITFWYPVEFSDLLANRRQTDSFADGEISFSFVDDNVVFLPDVAIVVPSAFVHGTFSPGLVTEVHSTALTIDDSGVNGDVTFSSKLTGYL